MLIAQLSDCHITRPGTLASGRVDTAALLQQAVRSEEHTSELQSH